MRAALERRMFALNRLPAVMPFESHRIHPKMELIYKIAPAELWHQAELKGSFSGSPVDQADGFIHLSTAAQVRGTAARHFAGQNDLLLIGVDPHLLGADLRYEPASGGALFPHLYAPLNLDTVISVKALPLGADGLHQFDDSFP